MFELFDQYESDYHDADLYSQYDQEPFYIDDYYIVNESLPDIVYYNDPFLPHESMEYNIAPDSDMADVNPFELYNIYENNFSSSFDDTYNDIAIDFDQQNSYFEESNFDNLHPQNSNIDYGSVDQFLDQSYIEEDIPYLVDQNVIANEQYVSMPIDDQPYSYSQEYLADESPLFAGDWTSTVPPDILENMPDSFSDWLSDLLSNIFFNPIPSLEQTDSLVQQEQFTQTANGFEFDAKNGLIVDGNVHQDIDYISQQTHSSCSLMAQEQFVARYYGESVSESVLEKLMSSYGVYDPESGTIYEGQTMVLDTFNIPYERNSYASINDLVNELNSNNDCIIGVDARYFYNDPTIPPGSGHAVTVVGKGIDPDTNEIKGFYITDSNCPGSAHFIETNRLSDVWYNDVISIPNPSTEFTV